MPSVHSLKTFVPHYHYRETVSRGECMQSRKKKKEKEKGILEIRCLPFLIPSLLLLHTQYAYHVSSPAEFIFVYIDRDLTTHLL